MEDGRTDDGKTSDGKIDGLGADTTRTEAGMPGAQAGAAGPGDGRPDGARSDAAWFHLPGAGPFRSNRLKIGAAVALLAAAAIGAGAATLAQKGRAVTLVVLAPQPVASLRDGTMAAMKGDVADVFGNKFVVQDASGRALVETGPRGGSGLVTKGETVTIQGRFEGGFLHVAAITHADGRVDAFGPPPPPRRDADGGEPGR